MLSMRITFFSRVTRTVMSSSIRMTDLVLHIIILSVKGRPTSFTGLSCLFLSCFWIYPSAEGFLIELSVHFDFPPCSKLLPRPAGYVCSAEVGEQ